MVTIVKSEFVPSTAFQMTPTTAAELVPSNIERATRIDKDYVIVKLRDTSTRKNDKPLTVKIDAGVEFPTISLDNLGQLRIRLVDVLPSADDENQQYLDKLAVQEQVRRARQVEDGLLIEAKDLAGRLGITVQAISKAQKAKRMFDLECGGGKRMYPAFYADPDADRSILGDITRLLGDIPASAKWQFFSTPKLSLKGRTPLQALKEGDVALVETCARGFVER